MSDRDDVLEILKTELKGIQPGDDNYTSYIGEIKRGYWGFSDAINKPFIGLVLLSDNVKEEYLTGNPRRNLSITVYCFMDNDGIDNYDKVHALTRDIEYFLKYDFSYRNYTFVNKINIVEGGIRAPYTYFDVNIEVMYQQSL